MRTFTSTAGSATEGLCKPSRRVSSSIMTEVGHCTRRGPISVQSKMRSVCSGIAMTAPPKRNSALLTDRLSGGEIASAPEKFVGRDQIALCSPNGCQVIQAAYIATRLFQAELKFASGRFVITLAFVNDSQVVVGHQVFRSQDQRQLKVLACFVKLTAVEQRDGQPVVCSVVVGIDFQTAAERGGRGRHVAAMVVRDAEVVMAE